VYQIRFDIGEWQGDDGCKSVRPNKKIPLLPSYFSQKYRELLRLEIGQKLAETDGSKPGFFRSGVTEAWLNLDGKVPRLKDKLPCKQ